MADLVGVAVRAPRFSQTRRSTMLIINDAVPDDTVAGYGGQALVAGQSRHGGGQGRECRAG
jgi:hypothetical protein